jgi:hypothetical protein
MQYDCSPSVNRVCCARYYKLTLFFVYGNLWWLQFVLFFPSLDYMSRFV